MRNRTTTRVTAGAHTSNFQRDLLTGLLGHAYIIVSGLHSIPYSTVGSLHFPLPYIHRRLR